MKRFLTILSVLLICIMLTVSAALLLVRSSRVQTAVVGLVTDELSRALSSEVHIDGVDVRMPGNVRLTGVFVADRAGDTLVYVPELDVRFNPFAIEEGRLDFRLVRLNEPYVNFKQYDEGTNIDFLLQAFGNKDADKQPFTMAVNVDDVDIVAARLRYQHIPSETDIMVTQLDTRLHLPLYTADSLAAQVERLSLCVGIPRYDVVAQGTLRGDLDTLYADDLAIMYRGESLFHGHAELMHVLERDAVAARLSCQDLQVRADQVQNLLASVTGEPVRLPAMLSRLGTIRYRGTVACEQGGERLSLNGACMTALGSVTLSGAYGNETADAQLSTKSFRLGRLLDNGDLGTLSATMSATLTAHSTGVVNIHVAAVEYKDYTYRDVIAKGVLEDSVLHVSLLSDDPNIDIAIGGEAILSAVAPRADVQVDVHHLRADKLGWGKKNLDNPDLMFQGAAHVVLPNMVQGDDTLPLNEALEQLNGKVTIDDLTFRNYGEQLCMQHLQLNVDQSRAERRIKLQSDFLNGGLTGAFEWRTLGVTLRRFGHRLLPSFVPMPEQAKEVSNNLDFYLYVMNTDTIIHALGMEMSVPKRQTLKGYIHDATNRYELQACVPSIEKGNTLWRDVTLSVDNSRGEGRLAFSTTKQILNTDSTKLVVGDVAVLFTTVARNDSLLTNLRFGEVAADHDDADIQIATHLTRYRERPLIGVHIEPSAFYLGDSLWTVADSHIEYNAADTTLSVYDFDVRTASQGIHVDGMASTRAWDSIQVQLQDVDLYYLLRFIELEEALQVTGRVSGWATLYSLFSTPMFAANLHIPDGYLNSSFLGEVSARATLDREQERIVIDADAVQNAHVVAHVDGQVLPSQPYWELFIHADSVDLAMVSFWTDGILNDVEGRGYGDIHVFGRRMKTWVTLDALAKDAAVTLPFTGVRYYFTDTIRMDTNSIDLDHIRLRDAEGRMAILNGRLTHEVNFTNFRYGMNIDCDHILALDLPYDPQSLFYGHVYASGHVGVSGDDRALNVSIQGKTEGNSHFYLSTATAAAAKDNSFISFQSAAEREQQVSSDGKKAVVPKQTNATTHLSMALDITPDATIHLMMDPHNGNGLTGRGDGSVRLDMVDEAVQMVGTYTLQSGTVSYSLANVVRRNFEIVEGSSLLWSGDATNPNLNVTARYRVTASLRDLFGSDAAMIGTNRNSVPVNCLVYLQGPLTNPELRFGIELPQSDESINSQVMSIINTEEMLMRQVVYLLAFNRFFTPEYLKKDASSTGLNETYSLLSSAVTGQINSWLGRLTDVFQMGISIRADVDDPTSSDEYEAAFRLQPVQRLTINGNFGYRTNDLTNRPFFGDLDVEYELTPDGKLRAKAYTHTVDKYSLRQANTVQGIGFLFRHDFNRPSRKKKK